MLRDSSRNMVAPKGRDNNVAPAAQSTVLNQNVGDAHDNRSTESPIATNSLSLEVITMAPVTTTTIATELITHSGNFSSFSNHFSVL